MAIGECWCAWCCNCCPIAHLAEKIKCCCGFYPIAVLGTIFMFAFNVISFIFPLLGWGISLVTGLFMCCSVCFIRKKVREKYEIKGNPWL
jgi:Cys-rich protein (TIGR01571 family)